MAMPIENCEIRFAFKCPKDWSELATTDLEKVRFCHTCSKHVYWCSNAEELIANKHHRHCVAIASNLLDAAISSKPAASPNDIQPLISMGTLTSESIREEREHLTQKLHQLLQSGNLPNGAAEQVKKWLDRIARENSNTSSSWLDLPPEITKYFESLDQK